MDKKRTWKNLEELADIYLIIDKAQQNNEYILRCLQCGIVGFPTGRDPYWTGVMPLPSQFNYDRFSHGYCPPCSEIAIADMHDYYDNIDR